MTRLQNPVFLTQQRLAQRTGSPAGLALAAVAGFGLLAALGYCLATPDLFRFETPQQAGATFYGWLLVIETLTLVVGVFHRVARTLAEEHRNGLWDCNRLTLLSPAQLVAGYWLGPPARKYLTGVVLALAGYVMVQITGLPFAFWLETQALVFVASLLFGLLAVLTGITTKRRACGWLLLLLVPLAFGLSEFHSRFMITNYLLPIYALTDAFHAAGNLQWDWNAWPDFFGLPVPASVCSIAVQTAAGLFLWRAAVRKTAHPFEPLLRRRDAIGLFSVLLLTQHGLIWGIWQQQFVEAGAAVKLESILPAVQGITLALGMILLALTSPRIESLRVVEAGRLRPASNLTTALVLAVVAGLMLSLHLVGSRTLWRPTQWQIPITAVGSLLAAFTSVSVLLEICRLRFRRHSLAVFGLALLVLCLLPVLVSSVFFSRELWRFSLLAPGMLALAGPDNTELNSLGWITLAHLAMAAGLAVAGRKAWRRFLDRP